MIHEALHTFSPLYTRMQFDAAQGWEEGVVEQMQRLLRPQVLTSLQISVQEQALIDAEKGHVYNDYIAHLEELRSRLNDAPFNFYRMLLASPLPERPLVLKSSGILLDDTERETFRVALLKAVLALSR